MIGCRYPRSIFDSYSRQAFYGDAAPILRCVWDDWAAAARTAELIEQGLLSPVLTSDHMRAHFSDVALVCGHYDLLICDSVSDKVIRTIAHALLSV